MDVIRSKMVSVMGLRTRVLEEGDAGSGDPTHEVAWLATDHA